LFYVFRAKPGKTDVLRTTGEYFGYLLNDAFGG